MLFLFTLIALIIYVFFQIFVPKSFFPTNTIFTVNSDETGVQIFTNLENAGYIRKTFWAKVVAKVLNINKFYRGDYAFEKPVSTYEIVNMLSTRPVSLAVLIPEGFTKKQIADRLSNYVIKFNKKDFLEKAKEGYLYPDTYYFFKFSTVDEILKEFSDKYNLTMLENFGRLPTKDEVTIASMLEREAKNEEDMKIISGIIQNRLKSGMPLQIDATVLYGAGIWKDRVLYSDLLHKNDYNTYVNKGLPIAPISNPGLNALKAAVFPVKTKYMYYLTGKDGKMYYAVTHDEHVSNKLKHLR